MPISSRDWRALSRERSIRELASPKEESSSWSCRRRGGRASDKKHKRRETREERQEGRGMSRGGKT
jgi:hypothetical protein